MRITRDFLFVDLRKVLNSLTSRRHNSGIPYTPYSFRARIRVRIRIRVRVRISVRVRVRVRD